jgi:nitrogen fixation protein FixH
MSNIMNDSTTPKTPESPAPPSRHLFWPILLTSLISIHIVSVVVMVIVATHDSSFAIEPDWYLKGLNYEQTAQQQRENRRLNWSVKLDVGQPLTGSNLRNVACTVLDREGKPVENATVDLVAFAHLRANNVTSSVLLPRKGGQYGAALAFDDPGMWEFRLIIKRGPEMFTHIVKREI